VFSEQFLLSFGAESEMARATSDLLTNRMAKIMDRAGLLNDPSSIALFSDEQAVESLTSLIDYAQCFMTLYQEAMGTALSGTFKTAVDSFSGSSIFDNWLTHFESRQFDRCEQLYSAQ
jgi:hypothetical protein